MKSPLMPRTINQLIVIGIILITGLIFFKELTPYLSGVLAAIALYVLLVGFQKKLEKRKWKPSLAAVFLMLASTIIILIPIGLMGLMLTSQVKKAIENKDEIMSQVTATLEKIDTKTGIKITEYVDTNTLGNNASDLLGSVANSGLTYFIILGIMYFVLYYMLVERDKWQKALKIYLPFKKKNVKELGVQSMSLIKSNAIGIPLVALLQGIVALIGFLIFGVENPLFWFVITVIGSMIPFVGTAVGIVPATILLLANDQTGMAIGFFIYGLVVIGSTDNLFRLVVQRKLANMHPMETLIGVVVGVPLLGFIGLIFGPVLVSLFLLIIKMYRLEYVNKKQVVKKTDVAS